jgi:hypothetical protein
VYQYFTLRHIQLVTTDKKPVTNSRDTQEAGRWRHRLTQISSLGHANQLKSASLDTPMNPN